MRIGAFFCLLFLTRGVFASLDANELARQLHEWRWGTRMDPNTFTQEQRDWMIQELRNHSDVSDVVEERRTCEILIQLGDRQTAEKVLEDFRKGSERDPLSENARARVTLETSAQPWVIPMLADELFLQQDPKIHFDGGDVGIMPRSTAAAWTIRGILKGSSAFPESVRESARRIPLAYGTFRDQTREWWRQNRVHFENQDYSAVTPMEALVTTPMQFSRKTEATSGSETSRAPDVAAQSLKEFAETRAKATSQPPAAILNPLPSDKGASHEPVRIMIVVIVSLGAIWAVWLLARAKRR